MGDILNLRCDAWLLPTDTRMKVEAHWEGAHRDIQRMAEASASEAFREGITLAVPVRGWQPEDPLPILTAVPADGEWSFTVVAERLESFTRVALAALPESSDHRPYRLLALPFFGTEGGGAGNHLGAALHNILRVASALTAKYQVDMVLVLRDKAAFSLGQKLRRETAASSSWPSLGAGRHEKAKSLGEQARRGHLVPFLGAGISVSAGAPTWKDLLERLAQGIRLEDSQVSAFDSLGPLDQAGVLEQLYIEQHGSRDAFGSAVASAVDLPRYGLAPSLLAPLPSVGAITLNYDRLFEMACNDAQRPRTVIPENVPAVGNSWLLKLHGSVSQPQSIVLTRDDYLGHSSNRDALSALVRHTY